MFIKLCKLKLNKLELKYIIINNCLVHNYAEGILGRTFHQNLSTG
jgi:hypothetical protein